MQQWLAAEERITQTALERTRLPASFSLQEPSLWDRLRAGAVLGREPSLARLEAVAHRRALWAWYLRTAGSSLPWPPLEHDEELTLLGQVLQRYRPERQHNGAAPLPSGTWQSPKAGEETRQRAAHALADLEDLGNPAHCPPCLRPVFVEGRGAELKEKERLMVATFLHALDPEVTDDDGLRMMGGELNREQRVAFFGAAAAGATCERPPDGLSHDSRGTPSKYPTIGCPFVAWRRARTDGGRVSASAG